MIMIMPAIMAGRYPGIDPGFYLARASLEIVAHASEMHSCQRGGGGRGGWGGGGGASKHRSQSSASLPPFSPASRRPQWTWAHGGVEQAQVGGGAEAQGRRGTHRRRRSGKARSSAEASSAWQRGEGRLSCLKVDVQGEARSASIPSLPGSAFLYR